MNSVPSNRRPSRSRRIVTVATAVGAVVGTTFAGTGTAHASSHREAPLTAGDPRVDNTDLYAFVSPDKKNTITLIANFIPFEEPNGGPNFYPFQAGARYDINIDNDGDAKADIIFRWQFYDVDRRKNDTFRYNDGVVTSLDDKNLLFKQKFRLTRISHGKKKVIASGTVAPSNVGVASMPKYQALRDAAIYKVRGGGKTFTGQADDPFFADLRVFDLLYGADLSEVGTDTLKGFNVNSIALQVPKAQLALRGRAGRNPVIGVWSSVAKQSLKLGGGKAKPVGKFAQVSRLGNPLVNEVVLPAGLKDAFNAIKPDQDARIEEVVERVTEPELPKLIEGIYKIPAPKTPRDDLVEIFLTGIAKKAPTLDGGKAPIQADLNSQILNQDVRARKFVPSEMLRLNTAVAPTYKPNRLGVLGGDLQGFPNGRRLADDAIDISLQAVEGAAVTGELVETLAAGDKVDANDQDFEKYFPYLALPNVASVNTSTGASGSSGASADKASTKGTTLDARPISAETGLGGLGGLGLAGGVLVAGLGAGMLALLRSRRTGVAVRR